MIADGDAWKGHPGGLEHRLTPVEIRLENQSGHTLRIRSALFTLTGESRFRYTALSPMLMREARGSAPACPATYSPGSWNLNVTSGVSWGWRPYGHWHAWWPGPYYYSPYYYPFYGPYPYAWCSEPLPTKDMLTRALPEGRLENGGTITGFLYFQGVADRERQVILQAQLVDADTGEKFGELSIPFQVSREH